MAFIPKLGVLPDSQQSLWKELAELPPEFVLYGGTAIALHLGHRTSVDFDFFAANSFRPADLLASFAFLRHAKIIQQAQNTLTCLVDRKGPVKVSFFGLPNLKRIEKPLTSPDNGIGVAALIDLAGTKASVVQQRAEAKDYIDLDAIITAGIPLPLALSAARVIYGSAFNPQITLKALSYFDDGDLPQLPDGVKRRITAAVAATDLDTLPPVSSIDGACP